MTAVGCAAGLVLVAPAHAAFPGKPGMIVFSSTFAGDREIFVAAADGSGRVDLTRDPHADITPSWSADGKRIAFASDRSGTMEIYLMNADGSGVAQLTHDGAIADAPHFSADGRYVVYESRMGGNWEIRRIGADGSGEVDLTRSRASDRYPATSPSGRLVAFASNRGSSGTHIWIMNIQGGALKQVTVRKGNQFDPAWAPAGGRLAYVSGNLVDGTSLWSVLANGKGTRRLSAPRGSVQLNPSWSPDARSITYQDCPFGGVPAGCAVSVMSLGGSPVDLSSLHAPFVDTFDAGDGRLWQSFQNGAGAGNTEADGKLTTTLAADSVQGGPYDMIEADWGTRCRLAGDFDVQVDYQLLEWPAANGVQAMLDAFDTTSGFFAIRESQTYGEQYTSWIPQASISQTATDLAGTLRLQREASTAVVSYLRDATWVPIASGPTTTNPSSITLGASSTMNRFSHQEVKIAWDNFRINSGTMSCPNLSWEDDSPDWQAVPA